jgi:hypothetical protein
MSAFQRKLLLVGAVAVAAALLAIVGLDWFHARMQLANGGTAKLDIGLRTFRSCMDGHCEAHRIGTESGFGLFARFTYWVGILYTIVVAIQVGSRIVMGRALHQPMTTIGIMLGVMALGGLIVCGVILAPASALDEAGSITVHRTWAMTLLFLSLIAGFYALYLAITDDLIKRDVPPLEANPVFVPRVRPTLAESEGIALEPESVREPDPFLPD